MGYPIHNYQVFARTIFFCVLSFCLVLCLLPADGFAGPPSRPPQLPTGDWEHLIITDSSLNGSFAQLVRHRRAQGLRSRIVSLDQVRRWSGIDDPIEAVRWVVAESAEKWGTRYVLLGGDAELIPVPLGYFANDFFEWEIPLDLYYAAPYGEWDRDGDGYLGEWEDDAPDLTPVVALGRAPVADATEVKAFVDKVIAFETGCAEDVRDVLLAAEVGSPYPWNPSLVIHYDMAWNLDALAEVLAEWDSVGDFQRLYQSWEVTGVGEPLLPETFLAALQSGRHRYLALMVHGIADRWSLGERLLYEQDLAVLAAMDHPVFAMPLVAETADCRAECMMETMLTLPDGGCAGALAPTSMFYIHPSRQFATEFWRAVVDGTAERAGDAYLQSLLGQSAFFELSAINHATALCMSIVGDPALRFDPLPAEDSKPRPHAVPDLAARAYPNPFNPVTEISFVVPEGAGARTTVDVFDLAGRRIMRLLDASLDAGPQSVLWKGCDDTGRAVGSGLYFARIRSGEVRSVVKLVLVE